MISAVARFLGQWVSENFTPFAKGGSVAPSRFLRKINLLRLSAFKTACRKILQFLTDCNEGLRSLSQNGRNFSRLQIRHEICLGLRVPGRPGERTSGESPSAAHWGENACTL